MLGRIITRVTSSKLRDLRLHENLKLGLYWSSSWDFDLLVIDTTNQFRGETTELRGNCCVHRSHVIRSSEAFPGPSVKYSSGKKSPADVTEATCMSKALTKGSIDIKFQSYKAYKYISWCMYMSVVLLKQRIANKMKDWLKCFPGLYSFPPWWEQVTAVSVMHCRAGVNTDTCLTGASYNIYLRLHSLINFASNFRQNSYWIQCHSCICRNSWVCISL